MILACENSFKCNQNLRKTGYLTWITIIIIKKNIFKKMISKSKDYFSTKFSIPFSIKLS